MGCKDIGIRKLELVTKTYFLCVFFQNEKIEKIQILNKNLFSPDYFKLTEFGEFFAKSILFVPNLTSWYFCNWQAFMQGKGRD